MKVVKTPSDARDPSPPPEKLQKPEPNQSKAKGLVIPIKPILSTLLKLAVYSARAKTAA